MKIFAIAILATVSCGANAAAAPHRKRSIKNKYVTTTNVIEEEKNGENVDPYLGYRKLEESMSMDNDGEYCSIMCFYRLYQIILCIVRV